MNISRIDDITARMLKFSEDLNQSLRQKQNAMITQKQHHLVAVYNLKADKTKLGKKVSELEETEADTKQDIHNRAQQIHLQKEKLIDLELKQKKLLDLNFFLNNDVTSLQQSIDNLNVTIATTEQEERIQREKDTTDILKYETYLGFKIKSFDLNLRFEFDLNGDFWLQLFWINDEKVNLLSNPSLTKEIYEKLSNYVHSNEFVKFLKTARNEFVLLEKKDEKSERENDKNIREGEL